MPPRTKEQHREAAQRRSNGEPLTDEDRQYLATSTAPREWLCAVYRISPKTLQRLQNYTPHVGEEWTEEELAEMGRGIFP